MTARVRPVEGLRLHRAKRKKVLHIALNGPELSALQQAAGFTGEHTAAWARDVLLARAAGLHRQRMLIS